KLTSGCGLRAGVDFGGMKEPFEAVDVRLQDERIRACLDRGSAEMIPPGIGDDEGTRARLRIANDVARAAVGQRHVRDDDVRGARATELERMPPVLGSVDVVAPGADQFAQRG